MKVPYGTIPINSAFSAEDETQGLNLIFVKTMVGACSYTLEVDSNGKPSLRSTGSMHDFGNLKEVVLLSRERRNRR
jgi:hypothetical protein